MALPGVDQTIRDGGLGRFATDDGLHVKIGISTAGTEDEAKTYGDPQALRDDYGRGPLVEAAAFAIEHTGKPVTVIRATQAAAGTLGAVTQSGGGPVVSDNSSAPNDAYELVIEILEGGAVGAATFRYSLDGGDTWSQAIATAATYDVPDTGISVAFAAGTYVVGDTYSAACTAPSFDTTGLASALDAALAMSVQWRLVHVVGVAADGAASASVAAAISSKMSAAEAAYRYAYAVMEAADDTDTNLQTAFAAFESTRVMVAAGFEEVVSAVDARIYKRPAAWPIVNRLMRSTISRDPGAVADGTLRGLGVNADGVTLHRDERKTPGLHDARFATLRTFLGRPGHFITGGKMMAPPNSDFSDVPNRQVLDVASRITYEALLLYVNVDLRVKDDGSGAIEEAEAQRIEKAIRAKLRAALLSPDPSHASAVDFVVSRTHDLVATDTIKGKTRVIPKGYARFIENEISFARSTES